MYTLNRSALVMHSATDMFALVNDVAAYAEFLPWCGDSKVLQVGHAEMLASVTIAFKGIRKTFTTRNQLTESEQIRINLVDGPFSELSGIWRFTPLQEGASKIELTLTFGFSNALVGKVVGPVFRSIADSMVTSFCTRADQVYNAP